MSRVKRNKSTYKRATKWSQISAFNINQLNYHIEFCSYYTLPSLSNIIYSKFKNNKIYPYLHFQTLISSFTIKTKHPITYLREKPTNPIYKPYAYHPPTRGRRTRIFLIEETQRRFPKKTSSPKERGKRGKLFFF